VDVDFGAKNGVTSGTGLEKEIILKVVEWKRNTFAHLVNSYLNYFLDESLALPSMDEGAYR